MRRISLALLLFAAVITAASARQNNSSAAFDRVREFIKQQLTERRLPSIAVAVARDGQIIWEEAFGWADTEKRVPATPHTMYSLASISKPITATGLMILKERGRIELDRPINEYLGEAKIAVRVGNPAEATVRRVANHTAGLPLHYQFFYDDEPYRAPSRDETIRRYGNCVTAPGERLPVFQPGLRHSRPCHYARFGAQLRRLYARGGLPAAGADAYIGEHRAGTGEAPCDSLQRGRNADPVLRLRSPGRLGGLCKRARPGQVRNVSSEGASVRSEGHPER